MEQHRRQGVRLAQFDRDLETEPDRIRAFYSAVSASGDAKMVEEVSNVVLVLLTACTARARSSRAASRVRGVRRSARPLRRSGRPRVLRSAAAPCSGSVAASRRRAGEGYVASCTRWPGRLNPSTDSPLTIEWHSVACRGGSFLAPREGTDHAIRIRAAGAVPARCPRSRSCQGGAVLETAMAGFVASMPDTTDPFSIEWPHAALRTAVSRP